MGTSPGLLRVDVEVDGVAARPDVLDDRAARRCAAAHNVPVIGSLGVALRCKRCGLIDKARPLLLRLIEAGMYLDERFLEDALNTVGE